MLGLGGDSNNSKILKNKNLTTTDPDVPNLTISTSSCLKKSIQKFCLLLNLLLLQKSRLLCDLIVSRKPRIIVMKFFLILIFTLSLFM